MCPAAGQNSLPLGMEFTTDALKPVRCIACNVRGKRAGDGDVLLQHKCLYRCALLPGVLSMMGTSFRGVSMTCNFMRIVFVYVHAYKGCDCLPAAAMHGVQPIGRLESTAHLGSILQRNAEDTGRRLRWPRRKWTLIRTSRTTSRRPGSSARGERKFL